MIVLVEVYVDYYIYDDDALIDNLNNDLVNGINLF